MKLFFGAFAYLAAVAVIAVAVLAGVLTIFDGRPETPPVLASSTDGHAAGPEREKEKEEGIRSDPNRVPVWIAPTAKYHYTPVPVDQGPKRTQVIGGDARGASAKAPRNTRGQAVVEGNNIAAPAPSGSVSRHRDNDPFFRD